MTQTRRLGQLNAAENWVNNYRYLTNADFKAYDFDSLRAALLNHVQTNYPEDFNDFINSSEYVALIDLMAYVGQNLAFRSDLNLRETFLETAEVRSNVLSIARQLGYKPYRNVAATGFLKISAMATTQNITDSKGTNLAGKTIVWGDPLNSDFNEQFSLILNQVLNKSNPVGRPISRMVENGVVRQLYQLDQPDDRNMVENFSLSSKNNSSYSCEIIPINIDLESQTPVEGLPNPYGYLSTLFNNDGSGFSMPSNGWFFMFKQGNLKFDDYVLTESVENRVIDLNGSDINNTDIWVQSIDSTGRILNNWTPVSNITGHNIAFNGLQKDVRKIFEVITRENDSVSIKFGDGAFSDIPTGNIRIWYRQSTNDSITFTPADAAGTEIALRYVDSIGTEHEAMFVLQLNETISNLGTETIDEIKNRASRTAATQERMITDSDYNVYPGGVVGGVSKVKAINRIHAGQSLYSDFQDPTGTYRPTISLATDGFIYSSNIVQQQSIVAGQSDEEITNWLENQLLDRGLHQLYYRRYQPIRPTQPILWKSVDSANSVSHGYFMLNDGNGLTLRIGKGNPDLQYRNLKKNTLVKTADNVWAKVSDVYREGFGLVDTSGVNTGLRANGQGAVFLNKIINDTVQIVEWFPSLRSVFSTTERVEILREIEAQRDFALRFDQEYDRWRVIRQDNINLTSEFSLINAGNTANQSLDASWLIRLTYNSISETWNTFIRKDQTTFGSKSQLSFFNTKFGKGVDNRTKKSLTDSIKLLTINDGITEELTLDITDYFKLNDSRFDSKRVIVWLPGLAESLVPNNPEIIEKIIGNRTLMLDRVQLTDAPGQYTLLPSTGPGDEGPFSGRESLKIQYDHVPLRDTRINPTTTNIIDMFVLTGQYNSDFRAWLSSGTRRGTLPLPPDSYTLSQIMKNVLPAKSISDSIVFHPIKFKIIFGNGSDLRNQVKIRVTKADGTKISDAEIRSRVIASINLYFAVDNWEFGETFYFTDMASWIHTQLGGIISSIALIPLQTGLTPNDMFQIRCDDDELFISSASVANIEIITSGATVAIA